MPSRAYLFNNYKIAQDSIFNLPEFYKVLFRWFEVMGYSFHEEEYADYEKPEGKQLEIFWYAEKKIDAYVRYAIRISFLITGLQKIEIEKSGIKSKTNKGGVELRITCYVERDYDGKWSKSSMMKTCRKIYDRFLIRERLDKYEGELIQETNQLVDEIRSFLSMHRG